VIDGKYQIATVDGLLPGKYRVDFVDNPPLDGPTPNRKKPNVRRRPFPYRYSTDSPFFVTISNAEKDIEFNFELTTTPN
jgi:hypothetical protein